ncbi:uncharacterized protein LOC129266143 [Lytechinus pictus]|uniref:uncharacterized protein LOC129266143 n=1 Tax=Lytechinus pictus TaxID=7653 RepID=UPI0030B9CE7D
MTKHNKVSACIVSCLIWASVLFQVFIVTSAGGPYPSDRELCQQSEVDACRRLGFRNISLSDIFGLFVPQSGIADAVDHLMPLVDTGCSRDLLALICGAYHPPCDHENGERMPPCRDTCRKIINQKCKGQMKRLGFRSEEVLQCRNYPSKRQERRCLNDLSNYREQESTTTTMTTTSPTTPTTTISMKNVTSNITMPNNTSHITNTTTPATNTTTIAVRPTSDESRVPSVIFTLERSASNDGWVLIREPKPSLIPEVDGFEVVYYNDHGDDGGVRTVYGQDQIQLHLNSDDAYTVLIRAFNETDTGAYQDARMEPYIHPHCEEITFSTFRSLCSNVHYRHVQYSTGTAFPSQAAAAGLIAPVEKILRTMDTKCADFMRQFLCTVYAPPCVKMGPHGPGYLLPCRELCQRVVDSCSADPTADVFSEMGYLNCSNFPSIFDDNATCYSNEVEISLWPVVAGKGHVIRDEGSNITAFCSASCENCSRPQWHDPNGREITEDGIENTIKDVYTTNVGTFTSMLTITSLNSSWVGEYICWFKNQEKTISVQLVGMPTSSPSESNGTLNQSTTPNLTVATNETMVYNATMMYNVTTTPTQNVTMVYNVTSQPTPYFMNDTSHNVTMMINYTTASETNITIPAKPQNASMSNATTPTVNGTTPSICPQWRGNNTVLERSYVIEDRGMTSFFRGWVDVQGQGAANDFCRIVRTDGKPFMSCLLAGSMEDDLLAYTSPNPSEEWFDPGYSNTWYMKDEDEDGRDDYCRCVGSVPDTTVVCMKAGPAGFEGQERDFTPESSPMDCFYLTADPFFGFP